MVITSLLAAAFTFSAVAGGITMALNAGLIESIVPQIFAIIVPLILIRRYIARARRAAVNSPDTTFNDTSNRMSESPDPDLPRSPTENGNPIDGPKTQEGR
jgi:hypothetical protein